METDHNIKLTAVELGSLWTSYMNDSMAVCILKYFLNTVEDTQIKPVVEFALYLAQKHIAAITDIFNREFQPIPFGFTENDVNIKAKRLFSDSFYLHYLKNMSIVGIASYGLALTLASRSDIRQFYGECLSAISELDNQATNILLSKGIYVRPPYIAMSEKNEFVEKESFLSGLIGDKRPLTAIEITHLFSNVRTNALGKALLIGFSQIVRTQAVKEYLIRGVNIAKKHVDIFGQLLSEGDLPVPMTWDTEVTSSTEAPFSEKLIMFQVSLLSAAGTGNYGLGVSASPRKDIALTYVRLAAEIGSFAESGAKIMIDKGWLEEPPKAADRRELAMG